LLIAEDGLIILRRVLTVVLFMNLILGKSIVFSYTVTTLNLAKARLVGSTVLPTPQIRAPNKLMTRGKTN
jgi:hypothetical protein